MKKNMLTTHCDKCEHWKDSDKESGCACPFPIDHCEWFKAEDEFHARTNRIAEPVYIKGMDY